MAIGYRMPSSWFATAVLDHALHGGRTDTRKLVLEQHSPWKPSETAIGFEYNGVTQLGTKLIYKPEVTGEQMLAAYDAIVEEVRQRELNPKKLEEVKVKFRSDLFVVGKAGMVGAFPRFGLMHYLACFTLFDGDPGSVNTTCMPLLKNI